MKEGPCLTYYQDVRQHCNKEGTDADPTGYWKRSQIHSNKKERRKDQREKVSRRSIQFVKAGQKLRQAQGVKTFWSAQNFRK
jgi:hypothetical protein